MPDPKENLERDQGSAPNQQGKSKQGCDNYQPPGKRKSGFLHITLYTKINCKWNKKLNKNKMTKVLGKNSNLKNLTTYLIYILEWVKLSLYDLKPRSHKKKKDKCNYIKISNFCKGKN